MKNNLDVAIYNRNHLSIKDLDNELDIGNSKWDFIFDFILANSENFYFLGMRLEYFDHDLINLVDDLCELPISIDKKYFCILIKIKAANLEINRKRLSNLWVRYEYPAIVFRVNSYAETELIRLFNNRATFEEIIGSIENAYLIHKDVEQNVLWVRKSDNAPEMKSLFH